MTPKEKAKELLLEYDHTVDNYGNMFEKDYVIDLKHEVLIDTCIEIIKMLERTNTYEIPFWKSVINELEISKAKKRYGRE